MKKLLIVLLSFLSLYGFSQSFELGAFMNRTTLYEFREAENVEFTNYRAGSGYSLFFAVDDLEIKDKFRVRLNFAYDKYSAACFSSFLYDDSVYKKYDFDLEKSVMTIGLYPLNLQFWDMIHLDFGALFSVYTKDEIRGSLDRGGKEWSEMYDLTMYPDFVKSNAFYVGLSGRLAFEIHLSDKIALTPQYLANLYFVNEFSEFDIPIKSFRQYLGLGIQMSL